MSEIQQPGSHCHLCSGFIAPTEWFYECQVCHSEKPKQPFRFCSACTSGTAHAHPVIRSRECACAVRRMSTFAASIVNRFTAFEDRTLISFPVEQFPLSPSPFDGALPAQAAFTYGQVILDRDDDARIVLIWYSHFCSCLCQRDLCIGILLKLSIFPCTLAFWLWQMCTTVLHGSL